MRKYFIDNIRILCILLLFPFHTAMIFNNFGDRFYVHGQSSILPSLFVIGVYPWWMSVLFALAGMSSKYALKKRTAKEYAKERIFKLLIPFLSAIILIIPVQSYIADMYFNNYKGSYIQHLPIYFALTDWNGYDGHFTPGHTWFVLYLFIISMLSLPIIRWYKKTEKKLDENKMDMIKILPMFILILIMTPILSIGGKSIGEYWACFLLGYFVLSMEKVQERLEKNCIPLTIVWIILIAIRCSMYLSGENGLLWDIEYRLLSWLGILAIIGLGKRFLEFNNKFTKYFVPAIFPIYIFHQSILVIVGYFVVCNVQGILVQYITIVFISFVLTVLMYEICKRIVITRFLFGIKKR